MLDGKALAATFKSEIESEVKTFVEKTGVVPALSAIVVGDNPASAVYVRNKIKACEQVGLRSESHYLSAAVSEEELISLILRLNESASVHGILLQLPLPDHIRRLAVLDSISPAKDVDGLHPYNAGLLVQCRAQLIPCTPLGVIEALKRSDVALAGKHAVVIGRSDLVGKPLALLLLHENATVTVCHSRTQDLRAETIASDIVISAVGRAAFLTPDFVRENSVLIDVGINVLSTEEQVKQIFGEGSKKHNDFLQKKNIIVGDFHPDSYQRAGLYTPVPGGVGPLTIAMLLRNTLQAARIQLQA